MPDLESVRNSSQYLSKVIVFLAIFIQVFHFACPEDASQLRVCVVAPRDTKAQVARLCNELGSQPNSGASCSLGADRLTCLRRVSRGLADLATLQAEDLLVAARKSSAEEVAVTNQLRALAKPQFEYEVAAVVRNSANITSISDLQNSTYCHPGFGYETDWPGIVGRFLESRVVPQKCDPSLTIAENAILSASLFFRAACKAGPWVPDPDLDAELKGRYPTLCALCDVPHECSTLDKYWGSRGPLVCLTEGLGDVVYARTDFMKLHFAPEDYNTQPEGSISEYSFLCPNGHLQPLTLLKDKTASPCLWLARPWPVVVANRRVAHQVGKLVNDLALEESGSWQQSLRLLIAPLQQHAPAMKTVTSPLEVLAAAPGWVNAATVSACGALGSPRFCVRSSAAGSKCQWLAETARAYGVRGAPLCIRARDCLAALAAGDADLATAHPDLLHTATRKHGLKVMMYEHPGHPEDLYLVTAVVSSPNNWTLADLRGKRACFPSLRGASWHLTLATLRSARLIPESCDDIGPMLSFFSSVCVVQRGANKVPTCRDSTPTSEYDQDPWKADRTALRCLAEGYGDVAFIDKSAMDVIVHPSNESWARHLRPRDFNLVCPGDPEKQQGPECYLGWAAQGMVRASTPAQWAQQLTWCVCPQVLTRAKERHAHTRQWRTMLEQMDELFGPNHRAPTSAMLMFGPFDNLTNLIFHSSTRELVDYESLLQETSSYRLGLVEVLRERHHACHSAAAPHLAASLLLVLLVAALALLDVQAVVGFLQTAFTLPPCCRH